jgi:diguanylate cyclase (GGDEF)-like protein/hemerythrin-like metal-binding protein/PAS domain S-box-containing protein
MDVSNKNNNIPDVKTNALVYAEKLNLLYSQSAAASILSILNCALLTGILWNEADRLILIGWFSAVLVATIIRVLLFVRYFRVAPVGDMVLKWERPYSFSLFISVTIWVVGCIYAVYGLPLLDKLIAFFFLMGMSAGAISVYSAIRYMALVTVGVLLMPMTLVFLASGEATQILIAIAVTTFTLSALRSTKVLSENLSRVFSLTHQLIDKTVKLDWARKLAETANNNLHKKVEVIDRQVMISSTDLNGIITDVTEAFCKFTGYSKDELIGKSHNILRDPEVSPDFYKDLWQTILSGETWQNEIKNLKKDGSFYWADTLIEPDFNEEGDIVGYTAFRHDITDKKLAQHLSVTDNLTGLYNRNKIEEVLDSELIRFKRYEHSFSIIIIDIDFFKQVNDAHGHQVGDDVLVGFAQLTKASVRSSDTVGRWGGEEFIIICPEADEAAANMVAEKIRSNLENHRFSVIGQKTASFGVSTAIKDESKDDLVRRADDALYRAKHNGRNRVECSNTKLASAIATHLTWRKAVESSFEAKEQKAHDPKVLENDRACGLGQWIYSDEGKNAIDEQLYHDLLTIHKQLHQAAAETLRRYQAGLKEQALQCRSNFDDLSNQLIDMIRLCEVHLSELVKPIVWTDSYLVGNDIIDAQHKAIIMIINRLIKNADDPVVLTDIMAELVDYGQTHFHDEEGVMSSIDYPGMAQHSKLHGEYLRKVSHFSTDFNIMGKVDTKELINFMRHWWLEHIIKEDQKIKPYLNKGAE